MYWCRLRVLCTEDEGWVMVARGVVRSRKVIQDVGAAVPRGEMGCQEKSNADQYMAFSR
jgi:hypothetical protein